MTKINFKDQAQLNSLISTDYSDWSQALLITQEMINEFAELTGDDLWIHVDVERAKEQSPFKSTIAHGFLILSLLPKMPCGDDITKTINGYKHIMNYGSDKLRFLSPVPVNSEIHTRSKVSAIVVEERRTKVTMKNQVSIVGQEKPSLLYQLTLVLM